MSSPVIAFIADASNANCRTLQSFLAELDSKARYIVGNDLTSFQSSSLLSEVEVIVPVVFAGGAPSVMAEIWPHCPKVRWIHSMAAGVDSVVPVLNSLPRGPETPLTNAKGAFSRSLAEYSLCAMLHFNKQVPRLHGNRVSKTWDRFQMNELHGLTAGFIGYGDIAQTTSRLCRALGMRVIAFRNSKGQGGEEDAHEVFYAEEQGNAGKLEVFRQSDFVICSLPGAPGTRHACGAAEFAVMKPTSVFISLGRGTCVDESALIQVLQARSIAGAALDVFEVEPLPKESGLWECENLLLSAHNADLTATYMRLTWDLFLQKYAEFTTPTFSHFTSTVDKAKGY